MSHSKLDASETAFFARELEHVMATSRDVLYAPIKFRQFLPVNREGGPGAEEITFQTFDKRGEAKLIKDKARDLPRVDISGVETSQRVKSVANSFGYSMQEIRAAQMAGRGLQSRQAEAAREAIERKMDALTATGDADCGWEGFLNHSSVTDVDADNTGTASSRAWIDKTPDNIIADFNIALGTLNDASNGTEVGPFRVIVPPAQMTQLATVRLTDTGSTLLDFLQRIPGVESIQQWHRNTLADGGVNDRAIFYTPDAQKLDVRIPMEFTSLAPQQVGLEFEISCEARYGGFALYYPGSMLYLDQI